MVVGWREHFGLAGGACVVLVAALLALPAGVAAQSAQKSEVERAQQHADEGSKLYAEREYGEALVHFRKAYSLKPTPVLLFNIGLTYAKLGRCPKTIEKGEKLRAEYELSERLSAMNRGMMAACARRVSGEQVVENVRRQEQSAAANRTSEEVSSSRAEGESERPAEKRVEPETREGPSPDDMPRAGESGGTEEDRGGRAIGTVGWIGVAGVGLGAVSGMGTLLIQSQLEKDWQTYERAAARGDRETYESLRSTIPRKQTTGQVLMYSGIGLATAGGVLFLVDLLNGAPEQRARSSVRITGSVARGRPYVGIEIEGGPRFWR